MPCEPLCAWNPNLFDRRVHAIHVTRGARPAMAIAKRMSAPHTACANAVRLRGVALAGSSTDPSHDLCRGFGDGVRGLRELLYDFRCCRLKPDHRERIRKPNVGPRTKGGGGGGGG